VQAQLGKVLASPQFRGSRRRCELLQWLIGRMLAGKTDRVKEYEIGVDLFRKPDSWDPRLDASVRVEFRRMRQKLTEYYEQDGKHDTILIEFPHRSYLPVVTRRAAGPQRKLPEPGERGKRRPGRWRLAVGLALFLVLFAAVVMWVLRQLDPPPPLTTVAALPFVDLTPGANKSISATA
jgi:hypothetical protein